MDELTAVREFRADVSAASGASRAQARAKLDTQVDAAIRQKRDGRWRWRARRFALTGLAAAAAVVALALIPTWSSSGRAPTLLERAAAAVSTGPVLHAVLEFPVANVHVGSPGAEFAVMDLATGRTRPVEWRIEIWYDAERQMLHERQSLGGGITRDSLQVRGESRDNLGNTESSAASPQVDSALAVFLSGGYERALTDGSAQAVGEGRVDGRDVTWLRFAPPPGSDSATEVAVDSETYRPLRIRRICPRCTAPPPVYRVAVLEGVGVEAADFTPPAQHRPRGIASYNARYENVDIAQAATVLGRPALWAGPSVGGLELARAAVARTSTHSAVPPGEENRTGNSRGLLLRYGAEHEAGGDPAPYVSVGQAVDVGYRFDSFNFDVTSEGVATGGVGARIPPEGKALITSLGGWWTIQLRKSGVYVEIDASSRELALEAVAALRPMTPTR